VARILGVDPGTWRTGAGILDVTGSQHRLVHAGVIAVTQDLAEPQRLLIIFRSLLLLIREHRPDVLALENVFYHKDIRATIKIGEARACAMLAAAEQGVPVVEYLPTRVKQAVTGNGRASKEQVAQMVCRLLAMKDPAALDATDALAVALCHAHLKGAAPVRAGKSGESDWYKKQVKAALAAGLNKASGKKTNDVSLSVRKTR